MKKYGSFLSVFIVSIIFVICFSITGTPPQAPSPIEAFAEGTEEFSGGDGTEGNPYLISEPHHLDNIRNYLGQSHTGKHFKLANNINMSEYLATHPNYSVRGWLALGNFNGVIDGSFLTSNNFKNNAFYGIFDGDGFTVSGIWGNYPMESTAYLTSNTDWIAAGLFGYAGLGSVIKNVTVITDNCINLKTPSLVAPEINVGFMGGIATGGIVGSSMGKVYNCKFIGNIATCMNGYYTNYSSSVIGGGIGGIAGSSLGNQTNRAEVIGNIAYANIYIYKGNASTGGLATGGVVGHGRRNTISNNVFRGSIRGPAPGTSMVAAGIAGATEGGLSGTGNEMVMDNNYANGSIYLHSANSKNIRFGGIVGNHSGVNSYASCNYAEMSMSGMSAGTTTIRGFGAYSYGALNNNFFNSDIAGTISTGLGTSTTGTNKAVNITTEQSLLQSTFSGFDFVNMWRMEEGSSPTLQIEPPGTTFTESYGVFGQIQGVEADIEVELRLSGYSGETIIKTVTGNANYSFDELDNDTYTLYATAEGYTVFTRTLFINDFSVSCNIRLYPEESYNVSGQISGANYGEDIIIEFKNKTTGQSFILSADSPSYQILLYCGEYTVNVTNEGTLGFSGQLTVESETVYDIELEMIREGVTVSGTISGAGGLPAVVSLYRADTGGLADSAAATASYAFNYVPSGSYYIKAECAGYITAFNIYLIDVGTNNITQNITFVLFQMYQISGNAYAGGNGLQLTVMSDGAVYRETDFSDGGYSVNVPSGTYTLVFRSEGYKATTFSDITINNNIVLPDVTLAPVEGVYSVSGNILGLEETDLADIYLENTLTGEVFRAMYCQNTFRFNNIPDGSYILSGVCAGYVAAELEITVSSETTADILFNKLNLKRIHGTVYAGSEDVLAEVIFQGKFIKEMTVTGGGAFEFELTSGLYTVVFSAAGHSSRSVFDIELGEEDIYLDETVLTPFNVTYSISGAIEGTEGALVNICLYSKQTGLLITTAQAVSGYAFTLLEVGEYILEPSAAGFGFERNSYLVTITGSDISLDLIAYEGAIVYLITYHNMDGAYYNNPQYYNQFTAAFTLSDPIKTGYEFLGWYQDEELTIPADTTVEQGSSGNLEFYASWGIKEYTITYVLNGGENHPENPLSFTYFEEVNLLPASSDGFLFGGWYDNAGLEGSPITTIAEGANSDKVLYARFIPIQVLILKEDSPLAIKRAEGLVTTVVEERTAYDHNTPLYLMGVALQQKVGAIKESFVNLNIVIEKNGKAVADTANISTGCEIKLYADDGLTLLDKLTVVVVGDTSGDGIINALDASRISNYLKGTLTLEGAFLLASDVRPDGKINVMDVTRLNQHTSGINPLY